MEPNIFVNIVEFFDTKVKTNNEQIVIVQIENTTINSNVNFLPFFRHNNLIAPLSFGLPGFSRFRGLSEPEIA